MPKIADIYPSVYLSAVDLQNKELVVTIERVEFAEFEDNGRKATKPVVYFEEIAKAMVFNKTNATTWMVWPGTGRPEAIRSRQIISAPTTPNSRARRARGS